MTGKFEFGGYKLSEVEHAKSFMQFLKITEHGADADEVVFPATQGIGLEIRKGSGGFFRLENGDLSLDDFTITTETMSAKFDGDINLMEESLDLGMRFYGFKQVNQLISGIPVVGDPIGKDDLRTLEMNFRIYGDVRHPSIRPDYSIPLIPL